MLHLIVPRMEREEVRRVGKVQQSDMAYVQLAPPGQQRQAQGVLVVVRDEPALDGVAHRLPPLVVLIENVAALAPGVLVDHQQRPVEKRQLAPLRLVLIQQSADGVAEPLRGLEPAVGQQGVQRDMEPVIPQQLHRPGNLQGREDGPGAVAPGAGAVPLAQLAHLQGCALKLRRRLLQRLLQLVRIGRPAIRQRGQYPGLTEGVVGQLLKAGGVLSEAHLPPSFRRVRRSVGEVVMASYSFWVAWNCTGTWL